MRITQHLSVPTLLSYASGTLEEPLAIVVTAHLNCCEECRGHLADMEMVGAVLMSDLEPATVLQAATMPASAPTPHVAQSTLLTLTSHQRIGSDGAEGFALPAPLDTLAGRHSDLIRWRYLLPGVRAYRLPLPDKTTGTASLLKLSAGRALPEHGHAGTELTLVLQGAYSDNLGRFSRGDVADLGENEEHQPVADADLGCVCLVASTKALKFKTFLGRLAQRFARI